MVGFANPRWRNYHGGCHPKDGCVKREPLNARFSHGTQRHSDHFYPLREMQEPAVQIPQRRARAVGEVHGRSHCRRPYPRRYALPKMRTGICAIQNVRRSSRAQDHPRQSVHKGNGMNESTEYQAPKQQLKKRPGISKCQGVLVIQVNPTFGHPSSLIAIR